MRKTLTLLVYAVVFLGGAIASAEYRVFVLKIEDSTTGQARTVTSTLDDLQYPTYFPIQKSEKISIAETWMCRYTRSDISQDVDQKYCTNPRGPASETPGANGGLDNATFSDPKTAPAKAAPPAKPAAKQ